jgi:D-glycerate 3-kinase
MEKLTMSLTPATQAFLERNQLPSSYMETANQWFTPLIDNFVNNFQPQQPPVILGINGCQGSGKSTLADYLCSVIAEQLNITAVSLSLDDFYLTKAERNHLAINVHPLLATRGVPGTHDVALAMQCIQSLVEGNHTTITRFDKSIDDRVSADCLPTVRGPVGLIILEGWCLGAKPQSELQVSEPINELEELEDTKGTWRNYVNLAIKDDYQPLFNLVDELIMLKAPSFDTVYQWRLEQEQKMIKRLGKDVLNKSSGVMNEHQILRFISHFQRVTQNILEEMPKRVDHLFKLGESRNITDYLQPSKRTE